MSADRAGELRPLPVTIDPIAGEALDGYLERLAAINDLTNPDLVNRLRAGSGTAAFVTIKPTTELRHRLASLADLPPDDLDAATLQGLRGIDLGGLDASDRDTWRLVAARGWAPARGTAICPACLRADGIWRIAWRHPWITTCPTHRTWLVASCPACGRRFRSQGSPLRTVDSLPDTCGNPVARRGRTCRQHLAEIDAQPVPADALVAGKRIWAAVHGADTTVVGSRMSADTYLAEIKALTVLILHLVTQEGGDHLADWTASARADRDRSAGGRGARWGLAPPADLELRGQAIAAADAILREPDLDAAASALHPWTELTPRTNEGQLGWLGDHTTMTPLLTRLVMAATTQHRRLSTLLAEQTLIESCRVPQTLPLDLYTHHLGGALAVTDTTGRLFAGLCLAKLGRPGCTWADAARLLGLPPSMGTDAARACTGDLRCSTADFVAAITTTAARLVANAVDYRAREAAVRALSRRRRWYEAWSRRHMQGSPATSRRYALTWLWATYAGGHPTTSPAWHHAPTSRELAYYRRYVNRVNGSARAALVAQVNEVDGPDGSGEYPAHAAASASTRRTA